MRPWSAPRLRDASVREPSAHDAGPRARRRASPPPKRLARGGRGPPSPRGSAPPVRGPSRGAVAPRSRTPPPPSAGAGAASTRTGLEPDGVAGRKQATARRPTQPAAVAHRRSAQTLCSLMIFACNQASSTVLELQRDTSATASGAGHGVRRRAPCTSRSLDRCSSAGGPPHLYLRPALVARTAERLHTTASCTLGQRARVGALAVPAALFAAAQRPCR